jgi:hypothetical protein
MILEGPKYICCLQTPEGCRRVILSAVPNQSLSSFFSSNGKAFHGLEDCDFYFQSFTREECDKPLSPDTILYQDLRIILRTRAFQANPPSLDLVFWDRATDKTWGITTDPRKTINDFLNLRFGDTDHFCVAQFDNKDVDNDVPFSEMGILNGEIIDIRIYSDPSKPVQPTFKLPNGTVSLPIPGEATVGAVSAVFGAVGIANACPGTRMCMLPTDSPLELVYERPCMTIWNGIGFPGFDPDDPTKAHDPNVTFARWKEETALDVQKWYIKKQKLVMVVNEVPRVLALTGNMTLAQLRDELERQAASRCAIQFASGDKSIEWDDEESLYALEVPNLSVTIRKIEELEWMPLPGNRKLVLVDWDPDSPQT